MSEDGNDCDHVWRFGGLRYEHKGRCLGSSARHRYYHDWFYCVKCLDDRLKNKRRIGNSYNDVISGAQPL